MKTLIIASLVGLSALPAYAEDAFFSAELLLGQATHEFIGDSGDDISVGIRGAYNFNANFALEGSYQSYGEASWDYIDELDDDIGESTSASAFNLSVKASLPLEKFSLYARLGLSFWDLDLEATDSAVPGMVFKGGDSGNDLFYGLGAQYAISETMNIGIEYMEAEYGAEFDGDFDGGKADLELATVGLSLGLKF